MKAIGLQPDNGSGGETGQSVSHHIVPGGRFATVCAELLSGGARIDYVDLWGEASARRKTRTKYTCSSCGANAWGKPDLRIACRDCDLTMLSDVPVETDFVLRDTLQ